MDEAHLEEYRIKRHKKRARQSNSSTANDSAAQPQSTSTTQQEVGAPEVDLSVVNNTATALGSTTTATAAAAALGTTAGNVDNSNGDNTTDMDVEEDEDDVTAKVTENAATKLLEDRVKSVEEVLSKLTEDVQGLSNAIANNDGGMQLDSDEEMEEDDDDEEEEDEDDTSKTAVGNGKCWFCIVYHAVPFYISNLTCTILHRHTNFSSKWQQQQIQQIHPHN